VDPSQLEQVIINLAVNARDAMPEGGQLTLETANVVLDEEFTRAHTALSPGEYVMVAVSDTGTGLSDEAKAHLFEPFFTTKEPGKGTGLGLATCYGIIQQNRGHIMAYSESGRGTTFNIYLPRVDEQPTQAPPPEMVQFVVRGDETVLLVEDDPSVRSLAAEALREWGYTVIVAIDGEEALRLATVRRTETVHLLLTDVVMPHIGGQKLAERLRETRPGLRVLFMSGYTDRDVFDEHLVGTGIGFLQKPFTPLALLRKVREVLDG
jgi:CheY-like chemotaxis protein